MTAEEVLTLSPGLYRLTWNAGDSSLAAVGITRPGQRWMAPVNWVVPSLDQTHWRAVISVELLHHVEE